MIVDLKKKFLIQPAACNPEISVITCSSSVDESCRLEPADSDERNLGGGFGGTLPEKHSDICM